MKLLTYDLLGEQVYTEQLENGLSVFVIPKKGFYKSFACFAVNYGGADVQFMRQGKLNVTPAGIAHFLEHKMFDTPDGGNALAALSANGASPNAMTGNSFTAYHFSSIERFEENLRTLLSFVSVPYFTAESVEKEQGIIAQEIGMIEDEPGYRTYIELMRCLYQHNPVINGVAGTVESISQISAQTLYSCHGMFYVPSNMALCVAGDVDFGRICEIAREILPSERVEAPKHYYGEKESKEAFKSTSIINMEVAIPRFMIGVKLNIPEKGEEYLRAKLKAELIGKLIAGNSSRLYSKLYREGLINGDLSVEVDTFPAGAVLIFTGESRNVQQVYEELKNECCAFINSGVEAEALERTIKAFEGRLLRELNSLEDMCYNQVEGYIRDYSPLDSMRILFELTEDELCEFARENFVVECMALSVAK